MNDGIDGSHSRVGSSEGKSGNGRIVEVDIKVGLSDVISLKEVET